MWKLPSQIKLILKNQVNQQRSQRDRNLNLDKKEKLIYHLIENFNH